MHETNRDWLKLSQVAQMAQGTLHGSDGYISSLTTDTRNLHQGQLFVALEGDRYDGHEFIDSNVEQLAHGALVHKQVDTNIATILSTIH